jgi:hypothetical protein
VSVLARKIARAKWADASLGANAIAADAVTADLRTTGNVLSFWRCASSSDEDLRRAFLAMAAVADRADRLHLVCLDESDLSKRGLSTRNTEGDTCVTSLRKHHVDVERLDLVRLSEVALLVAGAYRSDACKCLTKKEVIDLVAQAVRDNLVELSVLKDKMKTEVVQRLEKNPPPASILERVRRWWGR